MINIMTRDVVEEIIKQITGCKTHRELFTMIESTVPGILGKYEKIRAGDHQLIVTAVEIQFIVLGKIKKHGAAYNHN